MFFTVKKFFRVYYIIHSFFIPIFGKEVSMGFTFGKSRAFESLMQSKPGFDHYDSGADGLYPECRGCHFHRPSWEDRFCYYEECPYTPGRFTFLPKKISSERSDAIEER